MEEQMRSVFIVTLAALPGCFTGDLSAVRICSSSDGGMCLTEDAATPATADLATTDLATVPKQDMSSMPTCPGAPGYVVGDALACPGAFAIGAAESLCPANWKVCVKATPSIVAACSFDFAGGFFVAKQPAYWQGDMSQETCNAATLGQLFYGCGAGRTGTAKCGSFTRVIDLGADYTASDGDINTLKNTDPKNGTLCCPK
jgi:hypothetical protein